MSIICLFSNSYKGLKNLDNKKFPPSEPKVTQLPQKPKQINKETFDQIRLRGIPELRLDNIRERFNHDINEAKSIFAHLAVEGNFKELKRIEKYTEGRNQYIVITLNSQHAKRLILLSLSKLKTFSNPVYASEELTPDEYELVNKLLTERRKFINQNNDPKKLYIPKLVLQKEINNEWVNLDQTNNKQN